MTAMSAQAAAPTDCTVSLTGVQSYANTPAPSHADAASVAVHGSFSTGAKKGECVLINAPAGLTITDAAGDVTLAGHSVGFVGFDAGSVWFVINSDFATGDQPLDFTLTVSGKLADSSSTETKVGWLGGEYPAEFDFPAAPADPTPGSTNTTSPSPSGGPTGSPTSSPTGSPTGSPTSSPTGDPTSSPTGGPTGNPTSNPTGGPTSTPKPPAPKPPAPKPPTPKPKMQSLSFLVQRVSPRTAAQARVVASVDNDRRLSYTEFKQLKDTRWSVIKVSVPVGATSKQIMAAINKATSARLGDINSFKQLSSAAPRKSYTFAWQLGTGASANRPWTKTLQVAPVFFGRG